MKILLLTTVLWSAFAGGDRERGMQLYKDGKFQEAQAAFAAALKDEPDSAELQWNLALAAWRAGDMDTAEVAAEKYAANSDDVKEELHRGMLGAIRLQQSGEWEAKADAALAELQSAAQMPQRANASAADPEEEKPDPLRLLKTALRKAATAKRHFVRGVRANPTPELLRNTERTLRKIDELKKRIEELEKQQEQQENQDGDKNQDDKKPNEEGDEKEENKSDEQKGDQKESDDKKKDDQKGEENKPDEQPPQGEQSDKKPDENKDESKDENKKDKEGEKSDESEKDPKEGEGENEESTPEPKPNEQENPEPKPSEQEGKNGESDPNEAEKPENPEPGQEEKESKDGQPPTPPEPKPGEQRTDAPGEGIEGLELSPEKAQRLLDRAKKLDEQLKKAKARRTTRRRAVERDW